MNVVESHFQLNDEVIPYTIKYSHRRTMAICVSLNQEVSIKAPQGISQSAIEEFVRRRAEWVCQKRAEFSSLNRPNRETYRHGDFISFLGHSYQVEVQLGADTHYVQTYQDKLQVRLSGMVMPNDVKKQVFNWYRAQAQGLFLDRLCHLYKGLSYLGIPAPRACRLRAMKSRWGSCRRNGDITLNLMLIKLPLDIIDYVIAHELCHLKEFNHGPGFYSLMDRAMPDWFVRRETLKQFVL